MLLLWQAERQKKEAEMTESMANAAALFNGSLPIILLCLGILLSFCITFCLFAKNVNLDRNIGFVFLTMFSMICFVAAFLILYSQWRLDSDKLAQQLDQQQKCSQQRECCQMAQGLFKAYDQRVFESLPVKNF